MRKFKELDTWTHIEEPTLIYLANSLESLILLGVANRTSVLFMFLAD